MRFNSFLRNFFRPNQSEIQTLNAWNPIISRSSEESSIRESNDDWSSFQYELNWFSNFSSYREASKVWNPNQSEANAQAAYLAVCQLEVAFNCDLQFRRKLFVERRCHSNQKCDWKYEDSVPVEEHSNTPSLRRIVIQLILALYLIENLSTFFIFLLSRLWWLIKNGYF